LRGLEPRNDNATHDLVVLIGSPIIDQKVRARVKTRDYYVGATRQLSMLWADETDPQLKEQLAKLVVVFNDIADKASEQTPSMPRFELDSRDRTGASNLNLNTVTRGDLPQSQQAGCK
jgi:DNA polymerase III alpha subunit